LRPVRPDQELATEQRVPRELLLDSRLDPVLGIGAAVEVLCVECLAARMRYKILVKELKLRGRDLAVAFPPHRVFGERIADGMLVLRTATGMHTGLRADRPALHNGRFAGCDRMLIKLGRVEIPLNCS